MAMPRGTAVDAMLYFLFFLIITTNAYNEPAVILVFIAGVKPVVMKTTIITTHFHH